MSYLLDAHTLIWTIIEPEKLSDKVTHLLENPKNDILVSSVTFWEISLKYSLGKLDLQGIVPDDLPKIAQEMGFGYLPLIPEDASRYYSLKADWHRDPFDRMLIWQAINNDLTLLSKDRIVAQYSSIGLKVIW
jgi:PIN domain nuclease of toxin-antitoxin system